MGCRACVRDLNPLALLRLLPLEPDPEPRAVHAERREGRLNLLLERAGRGTAPLGEREA